MKKFEKGETKGNVERKPVEKSRKKKLVSNDNFVLFHFLFSAFCLFEEKTLILAIRHNAAISWQFGEELRMS